MSEADKQQKHLVAETVRLLSEQYESNSSFNGYFDGEEPLTIQSPREEVDAYQYERSKVLFWVDREAYDDERTAWDNKSTQERNKDALALLRSNDHLPPFRELVDCVRRQRIVPFLGAGLSQRMGMPLWAAALRKLHSRLQNPEDPAIAALIDQGQYLEAAEQLAACNPVLTNNFIRTTYRVQNVAGPVQLLPKFSNGCIVTTNFDNAIEEVFRLESVAFDGYMHGTQQHNFFSRLVRGQRCLLKLHGDADDPQTYILTKTQYVDSYRDPIDFQKPLPKALRQIFISNSLLFLGCSLEQDRTLDLFKCVKDQCEYEVPDHYAILPDPGDPPARQRKESTLLTVNIQPIWYPNGQHEFVEKLLHLLLDVADKRIALSG